MKFDKDENDLPGDSSNIFGSENENNNSGDPDLEELDVELEKLKKILDSMDSDDDDENSDKIVCPLIDTVLDESDEIKELVLESHPLGSTWSIEDKVEFLKDNGYRSKEAFEDGNPIGWVSVKGSARYPSIQDGEIPEKYDTSVIFEKEYKIFSKKVIKKLTKWVNGDDDSKED